MYQTLGIKEASAFLKYRHEVNMTVQLHGLEN